MYTPTPQPPQFNSRAQRIVEEVERIVSPTSRLAHGMAIPYEGRGRPIAGSSSTTAFTGNLLCRYSDVVRSAVSVGRENWPDVFRYHRSSRFEIIYRAAMVLANLEPGVRSGVSGLEGTRAYHALNATEKGSVNFFFGMGLTKLVAEYLFDIPWLVHFDRFWPDDCTRVDPTSKSRPDLVGLNPGNECTTFEAKGRSEQNIVGTNHGSARVRNLLTTAKGQASTIEVVDGNVVDYAVACATYFATDDQPGPSRVFWLDPPTDGQRKSTPEAAPRFISGYYRPFIAAIGNGATITLPSGDFLMRRLPTVDLVLGLERGIAQARTPVEREKAARAFFERTRPPSRSTTRDKEGLDWFAQGGWRDDLLGRLADRPHVSIGRDGVLVALGRSWDRALRGERSEASRR